ncbi:MAG TPA: metal-sensitive transcriptional regulator [Chloroflexota bacterium]|nr:metal-sensitive transcriptional regulator [Chloroflexota bacterium]
MGILAARFYAMGFAAESQGWVPDRTAERLAVPLPLPRGLTSANFSAIVLVMQANKKDALNRLATIEGHLKGIRKMVEEDQYCVDIVKQSYAVERALKAFEAALLESHLDGCVREGFKSGKDDEMIRELGDLFQLSRK